MPADQHNGAGVLSLLVLGMSNAAIAKHSHVAEGIVRDHVSAVLSKLDLADRAARSRGPIVHSNTGTWCSFSGYRTCRTIYGARGVRLGCFCLLCIFSVISVSLKKILQVDR